MRKAVVLLCTLLSLLLAAATSSAPVQASISAARMVHISAPARGVSLLFELAPSDNPNSAAVPTASETENSLDGVLITLGIAPISMWSEGSDLDLELPQSVSQKDLQQIEAAEKLRGGSSPNIRFGVIAFGSTKVTTGATGTSISYGLGRTPNTAALLRWGSRVVKGAERFGVTRVVISIFGKGATSVLDLTAIGGAFTRTRILPHWSDVGRVCTDFQLLLCRLRKGVAGVEGIRPNFHKQNDIVRRISVAEPA